MANETIDVLRGANYDMAEAIAPTWEKRRGDIERTSAPVRSWLLRELAPGDGDTVLELAAGVGDTGFEAAALVGPRGRVICSDFSPSMLAAARRRGAELGRDNVEYRQVDAHGIELDADSVDGVLCRFGYMLMDDATVALAETRRVLRTGGKLALAVWGAPQRNPYFGLLVPPLVERGLVSPPDPSAPGIFRMADPSRTRSLLTDAGYSSVRTEEVPVTFEVPSAAEYVSLVADTAGPLGLAVQRLSGAERDAITAEIEPALIAFTSNGGYTLPGVALCAVAS